MRSFLPGFRVSKRYRAGSRWTSSMNGFGRPSIRITRGCEQSTESTWIIRRSVRRDAPDPRAVAWRSAPVVFLLVVWGAARAEAHTTLPAYFELTEIRPGVFALIWRVPAAEGPPPAIYPVLPENCLPVQAPSEALTTTFLLTRAVIDCGSRGLANQAVFIEGLRVTIMDVLVRITFVDATILTRILRPSEPSLVVQRGRATKGMPWDTCDSASVTS